jgi:hypothetical protein
MNRIAVTALLCFASLTACGSKHVSIPISDVVNDPGRYGEMALELEGEASGGMGLLSIGIYTLTDSTGAITVLTSKGLPPDGTHLVVRGSVMSGVTIGGTNYGVSLQEDERVYDE